MEPDHPPDGEDHRVRRATEVRVAGAPVVDPKVQRKLPPNVAAPPPTNTTSGFQRAEVSASNTPVAATEVSADVSRRAADGFLVNGSVNNAASSPFTQIPAFGNNRAPGRWRYNGNLGLIMDNSRLDARPFSLTGQNTPRLAYNRVTGLATLGGPLRIPGLLRNGPQFILNYQWTRNRNVAAQSGLMPTAAERSGDFSQTLTPQGTPVQVVDPATGLPVPGNRIPLNRISPQAQALLSLYPLPNFNGQSRYNYQLPVVNSLHQDSLQFRAIRQLGRKNNLSGTLQLQSSRTDNPNLFGFLATGSQLNDASTVNWRHTFRSQFFINLGYQFTRNSTRNVPFFAQRFNVSAVAGITGNNQDPLNWGPPSLNFANGIAALGKPSIPLRAIRPTESRSRSSAVTAVTTSPAASISAASNGTSFPSRIREVPLPSLEPRPDPTWPDFYSVCQTPRRSPSAMPTSTSAPTPGMPMSPTTGAFAPVSRSPSASATNTTRRSPNSTDVW